MAMGDMNQLIQQAQKMQRDLREIQDELKKRVVVGESAGGQVKVFANGQIDVVKVEIEPAAIDPEDPEMLEDLVLVATQQALTKARELQEKETHRVTGGLNLPGML